MTQSIIVQGTGADPKVYASYDIHNFLLDLMVAVFIFCYPLQLDSVETRCVQSVICSQVLSLFLMPLQIGCRFWDLALREHAQYNKVHNKRTR